MRNLLIKLGLIKIDQAEYFEMLERLHNDMSAMILKEKELEDDDYNKSTCEIKIFFWVFAGPILKENLPSELFDRTMKFFRSNIIFSTIDDYEYTDEFMTNFLQSRFEFHESGIQGKGDSSIVNNYFQQLKILWFEKPFSDINELRKNKVIEFDPFSNLRNKLETQQLYMHMAPAYAKSLKKLIKMTKK